jgi:hypothetical protein
MASTPVVSAAHRVTEQRILELLEQSRIDRPDEIQYGHGCLRLLWHERKVAVVIDVDPGMPA